MPTAHALTPRKPIYDDDGEDSELIAPLAGTALQAPTPAEDLELTKSEIVSGVTIRSSDSLEKYFGKGRSWLYGKTELGKQKVDKAFEKYINAEKSVTSLFSEIKSEKEDILPGGIYVLVSTLSGSILARNRSFLVRGFMPVVFGAAAFRYFLPQTCNNTGKLIWRFEQKAPAIAEAHVKTQQHVDGLVNGVSSAVSYGKKSLESSVSSIRKFVVDTTGFRGSSEKKN